MKEFVTAIVSLTSFPLSSTRKGSAQARRSGESNLQVVRLNLATSGFKFKEEGIQNNE